MKKIRRNVFETNSSSTHSISIADNLEGIYDTIIPDEDGNVILQGGKFGWEVARYNDALTKANYCAIDNLYDDENIELLVKVIKEQTNCNEVILSFSLDGWNYSYIDHQSRGTSLDAFESENTLREFIFNPNSVLYTDNDNR